MGVFITQESVLIVQTREGSQKREIRQTTKRWSLRVKKLEAVYRVLPPTKRTFHIGRTKFPIVLDLVNIRNNLRNTAAGRPTRFPLLGWRLRP